MQPDVRPARPSPGGPRRQAAPLGCDQPAVYIAAVGTPDDPDALALCETHALAMRELALRLEPIWADHRKRK